MMKFFYVLLFPALWFACSPRTASPQHDQAVSESEILKFVETQASLPHRDYGHWHSSIFGGGGYLQNLVIAPSDSKVLYIYVDVGGVYRSGDAGRTWRMLHGTLPPGDGYYSVRGLDVNPEDPDWVVIAVGNQWAPRKGLFLTRDGGQRWTPVLEAQVYGNEAFRSTGFIFARDANDRLHFGSAGDGVWISSDHGQTWQPRGLEGVNVTDLTFAEDGRGWICAHAWTPHNAAALNGGFFFTPDHGETWRPMDGPVPDELVVAADGSIVGIFEANRLMRSTDNGKSWTLFSEGLPLDPEAARGWTSESRFRALAAGPGFLLVGSSRGTIYRRETGADAWQNLERGDVTELVEGEPWWGRLQPGVWPHFGAAMGSITVVPGHPDHWWFTDWYSAYESLDGGRSWIQRIDGIEVTVIHHLAANPADPARIHVGMADNAYAQSVVGGVRYATPKKTFSNMKMLAVSPALPGRIYGVGDSRAEWRAEKLWVSTDSGQTWWSAPMRGLPPRSRHSMNSVVVHPERPYEVLLGLSGAIDEGGGVYRSRDGGASFEAVNEGLESAGNLFRHEIWSVGPELAMSATGDLVLASHETGRIYYHDGVRWHLSETVPAGKPQGLTAAGEAFYLACNQGGLLKSGDGGRSWETVLEGHVRVVAADPQQPGLVAAATTTQTLISRDGGERWTANPLPPQAQVRTLAIGGPRLHAGTAGGGLFWMNLEASGPAAMQADAPGPGVLPVRETLEARLPEIEDPSFKDETLPIRRWTQWTGNGKSELSWSVDSADADGGSLRLRSLDGPTHASAGYVFPAVANSFRLQLSWKFSGETDTEIQIALRSYRDGEQIDWQPLIRTSDAPDDWRQIDREVRLAEGADRGEIVVVLIGEGSVWVDALSTAIPPQIFGNPQAATEESR